MNSFDLFDGLAQGGHLSGKNTGGQIAVVEIDPACALFKETEPSGRCGEHGNSRKAVGSGLRFGFGIILCLGLGPACGKNEEIA